MNYYFAPLEGIGGYIFRNAYHQVYAPFDKYYAPFLATHIKRKPKGKELRDILPELNPDVHLIPQLLGNDSASFVETAKLIQQMGYPEVNLNLGCPSKTVTTKGKGAGFLENPERLNRFFEEVFQSGITGISVKTRIGVSDAEEFSALLAIFNQYPIQELIVHPRTLAQAYGGKPDLNAFSLAMESAQAPVCYNGDICSKEDAMQLLQRFPKLNGMMIGRGILKDPGLLEQIRGESRPEANEANIANIKKLHLFHDTLYRAYQNALSGETNVLFKMKEVWSFLAQQFPDTYKYQKAIRKAQHLTDYEIAVNALFRAVSTAASGEIIK